MNPTDCDLVLEGGGVKGIALVGALSVLEERGCAFHRVAGTSAGSIVGALVAGGMGTGRMREVMQDLDYRRFKDARLLARLGPLGAGASIVLQQGLCKGDYLRSWLGQMLREGERPVGTFADLRLKDAGASIRPGEGYRLVVMASDVSNGRLARLPWDYERRYHVDPDEIQVVDAVRASMSIPFFYRPVSFDDHRTGKPAWLVDGGMLSNFPVSVFDRADAREPRWPTLGLKLSARPREDAGPVHAIRGVVSLTRAMVSTMTGFYDRMHIDDEAVVARTIFIDTFDVPATDFDLSQATAERLYESGRQAAEKFLDGGDGREAWDFAAYKQRYRSLDGLRLSARERVATAP